MGKAYLSAPIDEVHLAERVMPVVTALSGALPTAQHLHDLGRQHGTDFATMALYQAFKASTAHRAFIDAIDNQPVCAQATPAGAKIIVIPALFHGRYPEVGSDARLALDIAQRCGFETGTIAIPDVGSSSANADLIHAALCNEKAPHIWILAASKGSADFRLFLQRYPQAEVINRLRGWINVSGVVRGCQIADCHTAGFWQGLKYRLISRLYGIEYEMIRELRTDHPHWAKPLPWPPRMKAFNLLPMPLASHIPQVLLARYRTLSHLGPNDGTVLSLDALLDQGPVYPVLGCDHFFRGPQVAALLYRFFNYLRSQ